MVSQCSNYVRIEFLTPEDGVDGQEIGTDGNDNHGESKGQELEDDIAIAPESVRTWCPWEGQKLSYLGTAGLMFDFSSG